MPERYKLTRLPKAKIKLAVQAGWPQWFAKGPYWSYWVPIRGKAVRSWYTPAEVVKGVERLRQIHETEGLF